METIEETLRLLLPGMSLCCPAEGGVAPLLPTKTEFDTATDAGANKTSDRRRSWRLPAQSEGKLRLSLTALPLPL